MLIFPIILTYNTLQLTIGSPASIAKTDQICSPHPKWGAAFSFILNDLENDRKLQKIFS